MGGCVGAPIAGKEGQDTTNKAINKQLETERKKMDNEVKLLLLGAGESGKTTFSKQMRLIYLEGFSNEERMAYKSIIYENLISSMKTLINAAASFDLELQSKSKEAAEKLQSLEEYFSESINGEIADYLKLLWKDPSIQTTLTRSSEYQLIDGVQYFFENIDRLKDASYCPNEIDIINCRSKTTGITETEFDVDNVHYRMVDVGGQRSERKKWMHCFQDVTAAIFCVALSEYDLLLYEDDQTNRMAESLKLFKEICNNKWFVNSSIILFLNKKDLFEKKIQVTDLNVCFPEYTGGKNFEAASQFIKTIFLSQNTNPLKQIFPHITCATDRSNVEYVFTDLRSTLLQKAIQSSDLL